MEENMSTTSPELMTKIEAALDSIRPYLEADGGNAEIKELTEDGTLKIELKGACESCPMSAMTLKAGIEQTIVNSVKEVKKVVAVNV